MQWIAEYGPSHLGMEDEKETGKTPGKMLHCPVHEMLIWQRWPSLWAPAEPQILVQGEPLPFPNLGTLVY